MIQEPIKVRKSILLRTRYLNLLQDVKVIIIVNKKESYPIVAGRIAFREFICSN